MFHPTPKRRRPPHQYLKSCVLLAASPGRWAIGSPQPGSRQAAGDRRLARGRPLRRAARSPSAASPITPLGSGSVNVLLTTAALTEFTVYPFGRLNTGPPIGN